MNTKDLRLLSEAYSSIYIKENSYASQHPEEYDDENDEIDDAIRKYDSEKNLERYENDREAAGDDYYNEDEEDEEDEDLEEAIKSKGVVKISVVKKTETGEYVAKVYINGKYQERPTYYTDSLEDAIATKKHMLRNYESQGYLVKESVVSEAKKAVSAKKNINPWAVEKALEKKTGHHYSKEKKERIVKGIKKGAKKLGKKITSKAVKKK